MKLLLLNGNTDPGITARLAEHARSMCPHEVVPMTARFGARYIATRAAAAVAAHAVLDALAEALEGPHGFDAAIIACFGDPGLDAAREMFSVPILGLADSSIAAALADRPAAAGMETGHGAVRPAEMIAAAEAAGSTADAAAPAAAGLTADTRAGGPRDHAASGRPARGAPGGAKISLLTGGAAWVPMLREFALLRGHGPERVRVAAVAPTGDTIAREPERALALLAEAARAEAAAGAGCVVLGGAGLVGLAPRLRPLVPVPVLDCLEATLAALPSARPARAAMQPAPSTGLSPALSRCLAG